MSRADISANALKVLYQLNDAGYQAFIVGGGVRDLLLGLKPKDFDVATNASPEQVRQVFRNSRIIGRRFRIVHVHFGREIIEVSTFRAASTDSHEVQGDSLARKVNHLDAAHSDRGMILRDNVYGDIEGDVMRRDFTANALYYTVRNFEIHDFLNGMEDIRLRCLRMIGDPEQRYREDPVRVLRAIRLAAKLDFSIAADTEAPLGAAANLLDSVPAARLFDEFLKLFFAGAGQKTYHLLLHYQVFGILFPACRKLAADSTHSRLLDLAFASTDARIREDKKVTPAFLLAAILWPGVAKNYERNLSAGLPPMPAMHEAGHAALAEQLDRISIPKRFSIPMREIWEYQLRLPRRHGKRAAQLLEHKRFRAAYDFLLLREQSGEDMQGLGQWWTDYQAADAGTRQQMQAALQAPRRAKSRRRRVKS